MNNLQGYLRLLYIIHLCHFVENAVLDEGSDCKPLGVPGICTKVRLCPLAVENIKRTRSPGLKRCGFVNKDEIVCCPSPVQLREPEDSSTSTEIDNFFTSIDPATKQQNRFIKRKCELACEEISNRTIPKVSFLIIGGTNAEDGEFPHMAALGYDTDEGLSWDCSASIISNRFLITAAHCILNSKRLTPKLVRVGITKLNDSNPQDFAIKNTMPFSNYNPLTKHGDIALIEVDGKISFTDKIYPACLYSDDDDPLGLVVTGWGKTTVGIGDDRSNNLKKAKLVTMPLKECNISYVTRSKTIVETQICAGSNKSDACLGDSGGPLQIENKEGSYSVVGIVSFGAGCGGVIPGVYTRVSKYLEWIESIVWP